MVNCPISRILPHSRIQLLLSTLQLPSNLKARRQKLAAEVSLFLNNSLFSMDSKAYLQYSSIDFQGRITNRVLRALRALFESRIRGVTVDSQYLDHSITQTSPKCIHTR